MKNDDDSILYRMAEIIFILFVELFHTIGTATTKIFIKIFGRPIRIIGNITSKVKRTTKKTTK